MGIVDAIMHAIRKDARMGAGKLQLPFLLTLAGGVAGAAGAVFLTTGTYLTLSVTFGPGPAALLTGLGLTILAVGLLALASNRRATMGRVKANGTDPAAKAAMAAAGDSSDMASQIAFTTAFVLARYISESKKEE